MLGAIIGDIVGSTREHKNVKTEHFQLITPHSRFTDDTVMTLAVAKWLMDDPHHRPETLVKIMQQLGRKYNDAGYGRHFLNWLFSDDPQPYGSFGNGSAMRVSPVAMYASSLNETLELARITASVTHNHPEGIKGAQAIAACIYMQMHENFATQSQIKEYIERNFGYDLNPRLEDLRPTYTFDVTCQGSVPIAIMAYLQRHNALDTLRLAVSMGGDSDTIACMATSIAYACPFNDISSATNIPQDVITKCREILTPELLDINDRFEAFISRPLYQSYYIPNSGCVFAGEYPGDRSDDVAKTKIAQMTHFGVNHFIDLTEAGELRPYTKLLPSGTTYTRFPVKDCEAPEDLIDTRRLINHIRQLTRQNSGYIYVHCRGGLGRAGTIIACLLAEEMDTPDCDVALARLRTIAFSMPKAANKRIPETIAQERFVRLYVDGIQSARKDKQLLIRDSIRGSLIAGAAGDALGYTVEFLSLNAIKALYGHHGISRFKLSDNGLALVSDDTQMTLFTANGMLMGITRGYMRGIGGHPADYVIYAYLDWYYTQTGESRDHSAYTWLKYLPQMAHRRAPGNTCLTAIKDKLNSRDVHNNSKGCGGIMRVAPLALLLAGYEGRSFTPYNDVNMMEAGAHVARVTHQHPLGFLPAALLTYVLHKVAVLEPDEAAASLTDIVLDSLSMLDRIFVSEFQADKDYLKLLTITAVDLAASELSDEECIRRIGQGWVAEETWAIAVFCSLRHPLNPELAIMAAVNCDGDSDSNGSVTGNIVGAICGYDALERQSIFCPPGKSLPDTLELYPIIMALADDLSTSCIISEMSPIDTPEQRQWFDRYCNMKPVGIPEEK